jgi:3-oxo-5-alpha-steroid 4-dehydrogenase 1
MLPIPYDDEKQLHEQLCRSIIYISPLVFVACHLLKAPWGKTETEKWWVRPVLPPRLSWFVFESPSLVWALVGGYHSSRDDNNMSAVNIFALSLFILHYIQRAIVYPLLMSKTGKRLPLLMAASAFGYCSING